MKRFVGIAKEDNIEKISFIIFLYNRMLKIGLLNKKLKFYFYNKTEFEFIVNEKELVELKWFFGLSM